MHLGWCFVPILGLTGDGLQPRSLGVGLVSDLSFFHWAILIGAPVLTAGASDVYWHNRAVRSSPPAARYVGRCPSRLAGLRQRADPTGSHCLNLSGVLRRESDLAEPRYSKTHYFFAGCFAR